MDYSGVLIAFEPKEFERALENTKTLPGVEIHQIDSKAHRAIAVLETTDTDSQADLFQRIRALNGVIDVSLVVHHFDES